MTMLSFRLDDAAAREVKTWADRLGLDRSELLRVALRRYLNELAAEQEIDAWERAPLDEAERSFAAVTDWAPAEDWSDWADAPR